MASLDVDEKKNSQIETSTFLQGFSTQPTIDASSKNTILGNIGTVLNDKTVSDVTFVVKYNKQTREYHAIRGLFAAQSAVFKFCHKMT